MELTKEVLQQLAEPFPAKVIQWKPQATRKDGDKALAVAYIDARDVMRRLDDVVGGEWGFYWEPIGDTSVKGVLTVCGVMRSDVGEEGDGPMGKTIKAAVSDALKRCAVHFGIGRYLYYLGGTWVAYDAQFKRLKETPKLPKWALPGEQERIPQDAPAVAADEAPEDLPIESGNGHSAPPTIEPDAATILKDADKIKSALVDMATAKADERADQGKAALTTEQRKYLARTLKDACPSVAEQGDRYSIYRLVFGTDKLNIAQASAIIDLLVAKAPDGKAQLKTTAPAQVSTLYRAAQLTAGQRELAA